MAKFVTLRIIETKGEIIRKIKDALAVRFNNANFLETVAAKSGIRVQKLFRQKMYESDAYRQLSSEASLTVGELGLEHPKEKIDRIIEQWVQSYTLKLRPGRRDSFRGSFGISIVRSNYAEVLRLPEAKQLATSTKKAKSNQSTLRWLEWLLKEGEKTIIKEYDVVFRIGAGRTNLAVMVKGKRLRSWSVPVGVAGTTNDNFVTRVLDTMVDETMSIIREEFFRAGRRL